MNASDLVFDQPNATYYDFYVSLPHNIKDKKCGKEEDQTVQERVRRDAAYLINEDNQWLLIIDQEFTTPPGIYIGIDIIGKNWTSLKKLFLFSINMGQIK